MDTEENNLETAMAFLKDMERQVEKIHNIDIIKLKITVKVILEKEIEKIDEIEFDDDPEKLIYMMFKLKDFQDALGEYSISNDDK